MPMLILPIGIGYDSGLRQPEITKQNGMGPPQPWACAGSGLPAIVSMV